jgi:hypothetical protein
MMTLRNFSPDAGGCRVSRSGIPSVSTIKSKAAKAASPISGKIAVLAISSSSLTAIPMPIPRA